MALNKQQEEALKIAALVVDMKNTKGYKEVIEPFLLAKLRESFPDPTQFKDDAEYLYAAKYASIYKKVVGEVMSFISQHEDTFKTLTQKAKTPNVRIGGEV